MALLQTFPRLAPTAGPHAADRPTPPGRPAVDVAVEAAPDADTLAAWAGLVSTTPGSDVAQLPAWARLRGEAGYRPLFVLARAAGELVGGAMVLHRRLGPGLRPVAYLPFGPVLHDGPHRARARDAVCAALAELARRRLAALFVQPLTGDADVSARLQELGFRPSTAGIAPQASLAVDLSAPVAELHARMRSGARGSIKRAVAGGVRVRRGTARDLPAVAALLADTADHHGFAAASLDHLRAFHAALAPGGHVEVFLAERDGVPLAADVLTGAGGVLTLRMTGMRRGDDVRKLGAAALLRWETVLAARAGGYDQLDLGGIPADAVAPLLAGGDLARQVDGRTYYKASFGATPFLRPPAVELIRSPALRLAYDLARRSELGGRLLTAVRAALRGSR